MKKVKSSKSVKKSDKELIESIFPDKVIASLQKEIQVAKGKIEKLRKGKKK